MYKRNRKNQRNNHQSCHRHRSCRLCVVIFKQIIYFTCRSNQVKWFESESKQVYECKSIEKEITSTSGNSNPFQSISLQKCFLFNFKVTSSSYNFYNNLNNFFFYFPFVTFFLHTTY